LAACVVTTKLQLTVAGPTTAPIALPADGLATAVLIEIDRPRTQYWPTAVRTMFACLMLREKSAMRLPLFVTRAYAAVLG
jgi:hypothetical protein